MIGKSRRQHRRDLPLPWASGVVPTTGVLHETSSVCTSMSKGQWVPAAHVHLSHQCKTGSGTGQRGPVHPCCQPVRFTGRRAGEPEGRFVCATTRSEQVPRGSGPCLVNNSSLVTQRRFVVGPRSGRWRRCVHTTTSCMLDKTAEILSCLHKRCARMLLPMPHKVAEWLVK